MTLSYIFLFFFGTATLFAIGDLCLSGDFAVTNAIVESTFLQSKNGFEIALYLTGTLCLWLGLMRVAEQSGLVERLARLCAPVLRYLFPSIPEEHPVMGHIMMSISANILGLDNAATPLGFKTMKELETLNPNKGEASDAMIMFLVLCASGLTLVPSSIIAFRLQAGAANPADVFLPILLATTVSTLVAIISVGLRQGIKLYARPLLALYLGIVLLFTGIIFMASSLPVTVFSKVSGGISSLILLGLMLSILLAGIQKKLPVFDLFVEGAKDGFSTAIDIVPYLVAMLVGIGVFRASGAMDTLASGLKWAVGGLGLDTSFVEAIPTILIKPLSGSGARGLMVDAMQTHGADSLLGRMCCVVQGSSDTTFYIVAVYLGSIGIRKARYTIGYSLIADLAGAIASVLLTYLFFT